MIDTNSSKRKIELTKGLKIAAIYLIIAGGLGIIWPLTSLGPYHPEFEAQSFAYKLGQYVRNYLFDILFLISGVGLLRNQVWARKTALVVLVISVFYSANSYAWGFAGGKPSSMVHLISLLIFGLWNGIWFYLVYMAKPVELSSENG